MPLWAAETRIAGIRNASSAGKDASEETPPIPDPKEDAARMAALKKLRHRFVQLCSEHGNRSKPPVLAFERWLGRAALRRKPGDDPIIPSDAFGSDGMLVVDKGFEKDISRTLPSLEVSTIVAKEMTKEASKQIRAMTALREDNNTVLDTTKDLEALRKKIRDQGRAVKEATKRVTTVLKEEGEKDSDDDNEETDRKVLRTELVALQKATSELNESASKAQQAVGAKSSASGGGNIVFNVVRREGIYDVMLCGPCGKPRRPYLTVSTLHLSKLLQLWKRNSSGNEHMESEDPIQTMEALAEDDRLLFKKSLYCCLARYEALKGAGYQCAVPGIAFDAAAACGLGTTIECFASPLNCRYERFCSAFPDIEQRFGSLGSFFDDTAFNPCEGSFEANPPFVPEVMIAMGEKIQRLLDDGERGPLSFLVVIPAWGAGIEFIKNLEASVHLRASSSVQASDHAFCDGAQHTKPLLSKKKREPDPFLRPSSWDTAVLLLQNNAGASKWSVDGAKLEESFCTALKASIEKIPKKFATLSSWESRGVGQGGTENKQNYGGSNGKKRSFAKDGNEQIHNEKRSR
mmetsp:Transcript_12440/g.14231  ORF Transcript_12440/g.14231 Transcript_12440/m.14231 type:complete len:575 (+) Transcript_12440:40-1764(+)